MTPQPPATLQFGEFVAERTLGSGGFAIVYAGRHEREPGTVAIKTLHRSTEPLRLRLQAESEALARLTELGLPWFPRLIAKRLEEDPPFLVMQKFDGEPIDAFCDARRLDLRQRVEIFRVACLAMEQAHRQGVLHLDLKPEHVLVHVPGKQADPLPRIIDFGLADGVEEALVEFEPTGSRVFGTAPYMSPERCRAKRWLTGAADVYALGMILFGLVAGCLPHDRDRPKTLPHHDEHERLPGPSRCLQRLVQERPNDAREVAARRSASLSQLLRSLRGDLGSIVERAIEPTRTRRQEGPGQLAAELQLWLDHRPLPHRSHWRYRIGLFLRRRRTAVFVGTGAAAAAVALLTTIGQNYAQARENGELVARNLRLVEDARRSDTASLRAREAAMTRGDWSESYAIQQRIDRGALAAPAQFDFDSVRTMLAIGRDGEATALLAGLLADSGNEHRAARLWLLKAELEDAVADHAVRMGYARRALADEAAHPGQLSAAERGMAAALVAEHPKEALAQLVAAHHADPSHRSVSLHLAFTHLLLGVLRAAAQLAPVLRALNPDDEETHYFALVLAMLDGRAGSIGPQLDSIEQRFGGEAAAVADELVEVFRLVPRADQAMRQNMTAGADVPALLSTLTGLFLRVGRLQVAMAERQHERHRLGTAESIVRVPPSLARAYAPLVEVLVQKPFRPQRLGPALAAVQPGQADSGLLMLHAMGLVFEQRPRAALDRLQQALDGSGIFFDRRTLLLLAALLAAKTIDEWPPDTEPEALSACRTRLHVWLDEARRRDDWTAHEMIALYESAMVIRDFRVSVPMATHWFALAPDVFRVRLALAETLLVQGAPHNAAGMLDSLQPDLDRQVSAAKVRFADVRRAVDKARGK